MGYAYPAKRRTSESGDAKARNAPAGRWVCLDGRVPAARGSEASTRTRPTLHPLPWPGCAFVVPSRETFHQTRCPLRGRLDGSLLHCCGVMCVSTFAWLLLYCWSSAAIALTMIRPYVTLSDQQSGWLDSIQQQRSTRPFHAPFALRTRVRPTPDTSVTSNSGCAVGAAGIPRCGAQIEWHPSP